MKYLIILSILMSLSCNTAHKAIKSSVKVDLNDITAKVVYDKEVFYEKYNSLYINPDSIYGASNYGDGDGFSGKKTANGEKYNPYYYNVVGNDTIYTAANFNLPFGTILRITNVKNNKSVLVRINDGGPYAVYKGTCRAIKPLQPFVGRKFDLNTAAAIKLDCIEDGIAQVRAEVVSYPNRYVQHWCHMTDKQRKKLGWQNNNLRRSKKIIKQIKKKQ